MCTTATMCYRLIAVVIILLLVIVTNFALSWNPDIWRNFPGSMVSNSTVSSCEWTLISPARDWIAPTPTSYYAKPNADVVLPCHLYSANKTHRLAWSIRRGHNQTLSMCNATRTPNCQHRIPKMLAGDVGSYLCRDVDHRADETKAITVRLAERLHLREAKIQRNEPRQPPSWTSRCSAASAPSPCVSWYVNGQHLTADATAHGCRVTDEDLICSKPLPNTIVCNITNGLHWISHTLRHRGAPRSRANKSSDVLVATESPVRSSASSVQIYRPWRSLWLGMLAILF